MSDLSSYTERDAFNEALCNLVEEYLQDKDAYSEDTLLAINSKTMEIELGTQTDFVPGWKLTQFKALSETTKIIQAKKQISMLRMN